jgi:peptidoglycan/xylan/chitin deacetylase (PgdA/CDA1 family)
LTRLALARRRGTPVLCYHRIGDGDDPRRSAIPPDRIRRHLRWLGSRFRFVSALDVAREPGAADRRVSITFDDGYRDNVERGLPLLGGAHATLFLVTGTRVVWTEQVDRLRGDVDVTAEKRRLKSMPPPERDAAIVELVARHGVHEEGEELMGLDAIEPWCSAGHDVGAHTATHPILTRCDAATVRAEVGDSRAAMATRLGAPPPLFAYPGGAWDDAVRAEVEAAGFEAAYATGGGWVDEDSDRFALPRIDVRDDATVSVLAAELAGILPALRRLRARWSGAES